jgi:hypothetical protein
MKAAIDIETCLHCTLINTIAAWSEKHPDAGLIDSVHSVYKTLTGAIAAAPPEMRRRLIADVTDTLAGDVHDSAQRIAAAEAKQLAGVVVPFPQQKGH